jgi:hypothetical protein
MFVSLFKSTTFSLLNPRLSEVKLLRFINSILTNWFFFTFNVVNFCKLDIDNVFRLFFLRTKEFKLERWESSILYILFELKSIVKRVFGNCYLFILTKLLFVKDSEIRFLNYFNPIGISERFKLLPYICLTLERFKRLYRRYFSL